MNWEPSVLNKIYRTSEFKISNVNPYTMKVKTSYIEKMKASIQKYQLNNKRNFLNLDININHFASIYHKKENGNTFYFDYSTNYYFALYSNFFEIEKNYNSMDKNKQLEDIAYKWKSYLLQLLFLRSFNEKEFMEQLKNKLNIHLMFNNFLFSDHVTHYDIVLLSILQNSSIWKHRNAIFQEKELRSIKRWFDYMEKYCDIDFNKLEKLKDSKLKEMLAETYKLTSSQDLVTAVLNNDKEKLITLLDQDGNVNSRELKTYKTLLHLACQKGDLDLVKLLIKYDCDCEALDFEYMTPLYDAIYSTNIQLCDFLIEEIKVNIAHREIQDRTPFYWAACSGSLEMVDYLLTKKGVDINVPSKMGRTALSKACWNGRADIVARLCHEKNIMSNFPDKNGRYPLHNAVWGENGGRLGKKMSGVNSTDSPECTLFLIQAGAEIEVEDNEGYTPLMIAASTNGIKSLDILLQNGGNPNHLNKFHSTALMEATKYGNIDSVKCLLKYEDIKNSLRIDVKDIYNHDVFEIGILLDNADCFEELIGFKEKNMISFTDAELIAYLILAIQSDSIQCYMILIGIAVKRQMFSTTSWDEDLAEIIDRVFNLQCYEMFNVLFNQFCNAVTRVFLNKNNIQLLIKGYALLEKATEDPEENIEEENNNIQVLGKEVEDDKDDKDDNIFQEENQVEIEVANNEDLKVVNDSNSSTNVKVDNDSHKENLNLNLNFKSNLSKLINAYYEKVFTEKIFSESMLKAIAYFNDKYYLSVLIPSFSNEEDISVEEDNDKLVQDKKKYEYIQTEKRNKPEIFNIYQSDWEAIFQEFHNNSILSMAINHDNCGYVSFLLRFPTIQKMLFQRLPLNSKNILHILFERRENFNTFLQVIEIIESKFNNKISEMIEMLDELDCDSLTPLDVIMKSHLYDMVETYTTIINGIRLKYQSSTDNNLFLAQVYQYKIIDFISFTQNEIALPEEFKKYTDTRIKEASALLKKIASPSTQISNENLFNLTGYSSINQITQIIFPKLSELIEKVNHGIISEDFQLKNCKYDYMWIDSEDLLIECAKHLSSHVIIGVDLEFHGNNSEKDGIVCLLQISSLEKSYAIDTIKLRNEVTLHLKGIFEDCNIIKIFHGCDNDIVWLATNFEIFVKNIFDTGRAFQVFNQYILNKKFKVESLPSLNFLSKLFFQKEMEKSYQKSDWRIRPLTRSKFIYIFTG